MQCPRCHSNVNPGARFCPSCGFDVSTAAQNPYSAQPGQVLTCPQCGTSAAPGTKFCMNCAAPLGGSAANMNYQQGPSYNYQPRPAGKNRTVIIAAVAIGVLLIGGAVTAFLLLRGSDGPADVVKKIIKATERGDTDELISHLVKKERDMLSITTAQGSGKQMIEQSMVKSSKEAKDKGGVSSIEIKNEKIEGDTATVDFVVKMGNGESSPGSMKLVKEEGKWKARTTDL